jgi:uncharacterized protein
MGIVGRLIFYCIIILIELYFYQAVKTISQDYSELKKNIVRYTYLTIAGVVAMSFFISVFYSFQMWPRSLKTTLGSFILIAMLCQVIGIVFLFVDDAIRLFRWIIFQLTSSKTVGGEAGSGISRLKFLSYIAVGAAVIPGIGLIYGFIRGGYKYTIHRVKLRLPNLPEAFHGFKIVQLSDIHTGSFTTPAPLVKAFTKAMNEKPDIIFFTGDLVNDVPEETIGFEDAYKMLKAPYGVYSIFGNHDYAEYMYRGHEYAELRKNAQEGLKKVHAAAGWDLMMNEHRYIEKEGQRIGLIGVENWDARRGFSQYGDMEKATSGMEDVPVKILLSHSPSHWDAIVTKEYKDIDLTLSGHTHGAQFGIEIPGFKWSPIKYIYKQWAGMYHDKGQYLYVNRGLGFLGYNGRLGIWPEITVIELYKGEEKYAET